jgi:hypothetical protein
MVFYFNQFLHNSFNDFLKKLILIIFKGIEANCWYVYQTSFFFKISHMNCFLVTICSDWNLMIHKGKWQPKKNKMI